LFIKSHFTTNAQDVLHLNQYRYDRGMEHHFKSPGAVADGLAGIKTGLVKCAFRLHLELNALRICIPTEKNLKD